MRRSYKKRTIRVCEYCLQEIEYHDGKQRYTHVWVDEDDENESRCDFCKESGFDSIYII